MENAAGNESFSSYVSAIDVNATPQKKGKERGEKKEHEHEHEEEHEHEHEHNHERI